MLGRRGWDTRFCPVCHCRAPCCHTFLLSVCLVSPLPSFDSHYTKSPCGIAAPIVNVLNCSTCTFTVCAQYSMLVYPRSGSTTSARRPLSNLPRDEAHPEPPKPLEPRTGRTQSLADLISLSRDSFLTRCPTHICRHVPN